MSHELKFLKFCAIYYGVNPIVIFVSHFLCDVLNEAMQANNVSIEHFQFHTRATSNFFSLAYIEYSFQLAQMGISNQKFTQKYQI